MSDKGDRNNKKAPTLDNSHTPSSVPNFPSREREMRGVEGMRFVVTGGMGYVGATLCLELVRRGAAEVRSFDLRRSSPWAPILHDAGVRCIHGTCLV